MTDIMGYLSTDEVIQTFFGNLTGGEITLVTGLFWLMVAAVISAIGGAIGGILLAGKDIGYELAAILGSMFGPAGVIPVAAIGLVILKFI
ncbi:hypothetical protein VB715_13965 [Crocosphaera sp. UHCC 0190]|uniref:hypothetical protein n=1 Tax=Crocosphaera sp. UHCC 0190 TaxID=3110246 RepID=UPI002B1FD03B|nr:hypothetical protein [Crocosphaera sp. UHCC 0190]MEA5510875.1 hypothetical protein [Crocosphaera sp. UHCC 0190]